MRLWTVHPKYLDAKGLVAAWREALLAQKVIMGRTRGYRSHPQLLRFREAGDPLAAIGAFLHELAAEAGRRGYKFNAGKIAVLRAVPKIRDTRGQLAYEWAHLTRKLRARAPAIALRLRYLARPEPHPLFRIVAGEVRSWEKMPDKAPQATAASHGS